MQKGQICPCTIRNSLIILLIILSGQIYPSRYTLGRNIPLSYTFILIYPYLFIFDRHMMSLESNDPFLILNTQFTL